LLYADHTGSQPPGRPVTEEMAAKQPALDGSAPGRYAPGDATVGPINGWGREEREDADNPVLCPPKPGNLKLPPLGLMVPPRGPARRLFMLHAT